MTGESRHHPDLLRRFVPTPYIFSRHDGRHEICVESNDLEIALGIRHSDLVVGQKDRAGRLFCKVIRDPSDFADGEAKLIVAAGPLRVLQKGRGTILIHDRERSELLGFICRNLSVQELVSSLIPALLRA